MRPFGLRRISLWGHLVRLWVGAKGRPFDEALKESGLDERLAQVVVDATDPALASELLSRGRGADSYDGNGLEWLPVIIPSSVFLQTFFHIPNSLGHLKPITTQKNELSSSSLN